MNESINKIFNSSKILKSSAVSKVRSNRDYLISPTIADELNTYRTWDVFPVFNDAYKHENNDPDNPNNKIGALGVRSIFNKSGAVMLGGTNNDIINQSSDWRISNNVPLMDSPAVRVRIRDHSKCTVKDLVLASSNGELGRETYSYSDFMYCKHLGKMSNNYLITLRRFPLPVDDYISAIGVEQEDRKEFSADTTNSIGCLVTWMGTPGNDMSNLLRYSYKMPFKFQTAQWNDMSGTGPDAAGGPLNAIASMFSDNYRQAYMKGEAGAAYNRYIGQFFKAGDQTYNYQDFQVWKDSNKVYGPVDVIKGTYMRDEGGLEFDQKFTIQFDYELRAYNGINPRQAMLDLLSNILNVTYTTGTFWGGGYRGYGAGHSNLFANLKTFNNTKGMTGFIDSFFADCQTLFGGAKAKFGDLKSIGNFLNQLGGMIIAGQLNRLGRPAKIMVNSLLSPAPVGFWHLTIGNPHHPIMSVGNLILTNTTIEHYGSLGLDDFPTGLRVTCELERGKPRDISEIEKLYMHGNDRIYSSMGPKIEDMYKKSKAYKGKNVSTKSTSGTEIKDGTGDGSTKITGELINDMKMLWMKYFGTDDKQKIIIPAKEQGYGSQSKTTNTSK